MMQCKAVPSVATCSGVLSVILFRLVVTMFRSNLSNSSSTRTEPFFAAMWALVLPSLVVVVTRLGCFCRNSRTTSGWSDWAARWICKAMQAGLLLLGNFDFGFS